MNDKEQILTRLNDEFNSWEILLGSLSEAQITAPQPSDMSIKDVMAHLMAWQQLSIMRLEAALNDREPEPMPWPEELGPEPEGDPYDINNWFDEQYHTQSWPNVYQAWRTGFLRFLELAQAVPEADLLAPGKYHWLEDYPLMAVLEGSYEHHREHMETLQARLGS
jgi:hypothetical protein